MCNEITRVPRDTSSREVGWCPHNRKPQLISDRHRDHVLVNDFPQLNASIESARDDVERCLADNQIKLNMWVLPQKSREERLKA